MRLFTLLIVFRSVCVSCAQLTDDSTSATAGALQSFLSSCTSAILQAHSRSDEEANETLTTLNATTVNLFQTPEIELLNRINCPLCLVSRTGMQRECCGNGHCVNSTCQCNEGWYNIVSLIVMIKFSQMRHRY